MPTSTSSAPALTKRYGDTIVAVDELALRVRRGEVYGFLGPNGAGKTTTLRMLARPRAPDVGRRRRCSARRPARRAGLARIGAMIEHARRSTRTCPDATTCASSPATPGVAETRVRGGARPGRPERPRRRSHRDVLDGDEAAPRRRGRAAEGPRAADPRRADERPRPRRHGRDARRSSARSAEGGRTVLLSSHLMGEIEQVSDRVGVIRDGALVAEGTVASCAAAPGCGCAPSRRRGGAADRRRCPRSTASTRDDGALDVVVDTAQARRDQPRARPGRHRRLGDRTAQTASLEDVFLELTTRRCGGHDGRACSAELLVLRKRAATWILLGIWTFLGVFFAYVVPYALDPEDATAGGSPSSCPVAGGHAARRLSVLRRRVRAHARGVRAGQRVRLGHAEDAVRAGPEPAARVRRQARGARRSCSSRSSSRSSPPARSRAS